MTFEEWFLSSPHRGKYDSASPAYLAARESWQAAKRDALLEAAKWFVEIEADLDTGRDIAAAQQLLRMAKEIK
jgi:hypothetical protein